MHIAAACRKLVLNLRGDQHRAQVVADLVHDRLWRSDRRHHALPTDGDKSWQRFRHGRQVGEAGQALRCCDRQGLELA